MVEVLTLIVIASLILVVAADIHADPDGYNGDLDEMTRDEDHDGTDMGPCMCDACVETYPSHAEMDEPHLESGMLGHMLSTAERERIFNLVKGGHYRG